MPSKLTRRQLGAILAASAAPALVRAQASERQSPEELLATAKAEARNNADALAKFQLPMATEPAFRFEP